MANKSIRVAMVQPFLAHYREPIYNLLCRQSNPDPEYIFYSDKASNIPLLTIDTGKASISPKYGGLNWIFINSSE